MKEKPTTKLCKHCKSEIPYSAKVCPQCRKRQGGILKWVIIIFLFFWLIGVFSGGDESQKVENFSEKPENKNKEMKAQSPSEIATDPMSDDIIDVDIAKCHVKYIRHEITENMAGEKCVAIYYEFTNNSNEGKMFYTTISDKAFQEGIELESSLFHINDESKDRDAEIKPGVTVTVCSGFVLRDEVSDVELEIGEWITLKDKPDDKMILLIK